MMNDNVMQGDMVLGDAVGSVAAERESMQADERQRRLGVLAAVWQYDEDEGARALVDGDGRYGVYGANQMRVPGALHVYGKDFAEVAAPELAESPLELCERTIKGMPEERRRRWQEEYDALFTSGKDSKRDWYALYGRMVKDGVLEGVAERKRAEEEQRRELSELPEDVARELPGYVAGGELSAELVGKLDKFKQMEELRPSLERGRAAFAAIARMQHGGEADGYEERVQDEAKRLRDEYARTKAAYVQAGGGVDDWADKTEDEILQQARANVGGSYEVGREQMRELADLLTDEKGELDVRALSSVLLALDADAEGQQTIDSKFLRNMITGMVRWAKESEDYARRYGSGAVRDALYADETMAFAARKSYSLSTPRWNEGMNVEDVKIDPNVEKMKNELSKLEDRRLSPSEKADFLAAVMTDLGGIVGENVPFLATAPAGGWVGLAAGAAAMFPGMANREIAQAYADGEAHPELVGNVRGFAQAGAEGMFGRVIGGNKLVGRVLDKVAARTMSVPVLGKTLGVMQGNSFLRFAAEVSGESVGELFIEDTVADGVSCLTLGGLRALGVDVSEQEFQGFAPQWEAFKGDPRQSAATVAYCAVMGLLGVGGVRGQARAFAANVHNLEAAGLKPGTARELSALAASENVAEEELRERAAAAYTAEVLDEDPVVLKKRLEENGKKFLEMAEVAAYARSGVRDYVLKQAGILAPEQNADGTYRVTRQVQDAKGEEQAVESSWTEEQLNAYVAMRAEDMTVRAMREFQARVQGQALVGSAQVDAERVKGEIVSLRELPTAAVAVMQKNGGVINYEVLEALSDEARQTVEGFVAEGMSREEAAARQSAVPNVSLGVLMRAARAFGARVDAMVGTPEGEALGIRTRGDASTAIFRLDAMSPGQSVLLYNAGAVSEREVVEDLIERDLVAAMQEPGALAALGGLLREVEQNVRRYDRKARFLPEKEALSEQDVIEGFSTLAQSRFLLNHARYNMPQEAHDSIEYVQKKLADAQHLVALSHAWDAFASSDEGQKFIREKGASLEKLVEDAGASVAGRYAQAKVNADMFEVVRSAYDAATSVERAREVHEQYEEEQRELDNPLPPEVPEPIPAKDSITGEEVSSEEQQGGWLFGEESGLMPPSDDVQQGEPGRGLVNGEFVRLGDGSVYGVAEVESIELSRDVPQFKKKDSAVGRVQADEDGTTHELSGGWNAKTDAIIVWRRASGKLEVISGRHRLAHARKNDVKHIAVRVYDEDAEHDANWAKLYDVEVNILANTCNAIDVAYYFRHNPMSLGEAEARGLMPKTRAGEQTAASRMGIEIAAKASDDTFDALINGAFGVEDVHMACVIAGSPEGQALALTERQGKNGKKQSWEYVTALVRGSEQMSGGGAMLDLFGWDTGFKEKAEKMARYVEAVRGQLKQRISVLASAGGLQRRADVAKREGVKAERPKDAVERMAKLAQLDAAYERMDAGLGIAEKADAWDGKSAVAVDESELDGVGASFSVVSRRLYKELQGAFTQMPDKKSGKKVWVKKAKTKSMFVVCPYPDILNRVIPWNRNVVVKAEIAKKLLNKHHFTMHDVARLPHALNDPIAVFEENPRSLVIITDIRTQNDKGETKNALAVLELRMDDDAVRITEVKTAYAADKQSKYAHLFNGKQLRYADKARALQWAKEEGSSIFQLLTTSLAEPGSKVMLKENMPDVNYNLSDGVSFSVIGERAATWDRYKDRAFKGQDDGMMRAELDASKAKLNDWGVEQRADTRLLKAVERVRGELSADELKKGRELDSELMKELDAGWQGDKEAMARAFELKKRRDEQARELAKKHFKPYGKINPALLWLAVYRGSEKDLENIVEDGRKAGVVRDFRTNLVNMLDFAELYEAYPQLMNLPVIKKALERNHQGSLRIHDGGGSFNEVEDMDIVLNEDLSAGEMRRVLLHEVQHAIQRIEGFEEGAGGQGMSVSDYWNAPGEREARNVERRADMSAEERGRVPFNETLDGGGSFSVTDARARGLFKDGVMEAGNAVITEPSFSVSAQHASPHKFKGFDLEHIGEGEGAQAYGYGLYFSGNWGVNSNYHENFSKTQYRYLIRGNEVSFGDLLSEARRVGGLDGSVLPNSREEYARRIEELEKIVAEGGNEYIWEEDARRDLEGYKALLENEIFIESSQALAMNYLVDLAVEDGELLNWDEGNGAEGVDPDMGSLSYEVAKMVLFGGETDIERQLAVLDEHRWANDEWEYHYRKERENADDMFVDYWASVIVNNEYTGEEVYSTLKHRMGSQKAASEWLLAQGIKGIRYADGATRNSEGEKTYNYVIFDPSVIKVRKVAERKPWSSDTEDASIWQDYEGWTSSFSVRGRASVLDRVNLREMAEEEAVVRLMNRARRGINRWRRVFAGDETGAAAAAQALGEVGSVMEAVLQYLPAGKRPHYAQQLRLVEAYARVMETGRVRAVNKEVKGEVSQRRQEVLREVMAELEKVGNLKGEALREMREMYTRQVAERRLGDVVLGMVEDAVGAMERYLVEREVGKLDVLAERLKPKKGKNGKLMRGKMSAAAYREFARLYGLVNMTQAERDARLDELQKAIVAEQVAAEVDEAKVDELTAQVKEVAMFGALRVAGLVNARRAVAALVEYARAERAVWKEAQELEKARAKRVARLATDALGGANEHRAADVKEAESGMRGMMGAMLKGFESVSQMWLGMEGVPELRELARGSIDALARGNVQLALREKAWREREREFMARELGLATEGKRNDWMARMKAVEDTGVKRAGELRQHRVRLTVEEAREVVGMSKEERERRNEELRRAAEAQGVDAENIVLEDDVPLLREELARVESDGGRAQYVQTKREWREEAARESMKMSRDEALNVLLLCEQADYAEAAEGHGFTAEVLDGLRKFVGEDVMAYGYFMRDALEGNGLAEVYEAREGVPFPKVENYWPGRFDQSSRVNENANALEVAAGMGTAYGMLIKRVKHHKRFDLSIGATNSFRAAMAQQNNYICMGELTSRWRKMLAHADFALALKNYMGDAQFKTFKGLLNLIDGQGAQISAQEALSGRMVRMMQSAHAMAVLSGAVPTLVKQTSAILNGMVYGGVGMWELLREMHRPGAASLRDIMELDCIKARFAGEEEYERMQKMGRNVGWSRTAMMARVGMDLIGKVDVWMNVVSMRALYNATYRRLKRKQEGAADALSEAEIRQECERVVQDALELGAQPLRDTQKAANLALGRAGVMMRVLGYMGSETFNKVGAAVATYHRHGGGVRGARAALKYAVGMSTVMQVAMMVVQLMRGETPAAGEDDEWVSWLLTNALTGFSGAALLQGVPLAGELVSEATGDYVKTGTYGQQIFDYRGAWRTTQKLWDAFSGEKKLSDGELMWQLLQELRFATFLTGVKGGVYAAGWMAEVAGSLQSVNAVGNFVRPFVQHVRNEEREEKKKRR